MGQYQKYASDISYASCARTTSGRVLIKILENITGRRNLLNKALGYERELSDGHNFWSIMFQRFGLSLEILNGALLSLIHI